MDLYSPQNRILLKNCIIIKLKQLNIKLNQLENASTPKNEFEDTENTISYYTNLYEMLKNDDTESLVTTIHDSMYEEEFNKRIMNHSSKEIAQEYIDLTKSLIEENYVYSAEKFEELKRAFYKGNEHLLKTTSYATLEEEPSSEASAITNYLTDEMKISLNDLQELLEQNKNLNTITPFGFKNFSLQLKEITKNLTKYKLEQAYEKKIADESFAIEYDHKTARPTYRIELALTETPTQIEHLVVPASTSGFISTPFQNLCYTYLEAKKYSTTSENLLDSSIITQKMLAFRDSCKLLSKTMSDSCFTISNGHIIPKAHASYEPELSNEVACDGQVQGDNDDELQI